MESEAPDYITEDGVAVWLDISDQHLPCDHIEEPTDYPDRPYVCTTTAERRYGDFRACNYHFERAHLAARDEALYGRAFDADIGRLD